MTTAHPTPEPATPAHDDGRLATVREAAAYVASWIAYQGELRGTPGIQAAIRYRGELVLDLSWGVADVTTGQPLTSEHLFRIASHSKTFTATAIMQLAAAGALRLDDCVGRWLAELVGTELEEVTIRELLGHQGGVIRDGADADYWQRGAPFPDHDTLREISRNEGRVFARNEHFKYSNVGFGLLGLVIEAASGVSYEEYVMSRIVAPLKLTRTGPEWDPARADEYAAGHTGLIAQNDVRRTIMHVDTRALAPATGWYSTAVELSAYLDAHRLGDDRLLDDDAKRLLHRRESEIVSGGVLHRYGLGFELREVDGTDLVGHSGGYPGHITRTWLDPANEIVVSVLTNAIDGPADLLATGAVSLLRLALSVSDSSSAATEGAPTGRFASLWSVLDIAKLGGEVFALYPAQVDPAATAEPLRTMEGELRTEEKAGFGATGERVHVERSEDGGVRMVVVGGMTLWPIDTYRYALKTREPSKLLGRMSL